jgi:hypothetical protein
MRRAFTAAIKGQPGLVKFHLLQLNRDMGGQLAVNAI